MNATKLLTPKAVAERLDCSVKVVLQQARAGRLEGSRIGRQWRFSEVQVDRYVARARYHPSPSPQVTPRAPRQVATRLQLEGAGEFL